jgi:hypothetical protein
VRFRMLALDPDLEFRTVATTLDDVAADGCQLG